MKTDYINLKNAFFPPNVKRSCYYQEGRITALLNCNKVLIKLIEGLILLTSIVISFKYIKNYHSFKSFSYEVKDTFLWSVSSYRVQYENAKSYEKMKNDLKKTI